MGATSDNQEIVDVDISLIDENEDNQEIFNMDDIKILARTIEENGFIGAVEVFLKPDGRYELSSGHRRVRAMRLLEKKTVPCIVSELPDDIKRAKRLIDSNITNRTLKPLDYARAIEYYIENVLIPSGQTKDIDGKCAKYFNISKSSVYKYRAVIKMIPELQEMANNPQFPFTGFVSAHRLSEEQQLELYKDIIAYHESHRDENGDLIEVGRKWIEDEVRKHLEKANRRRTITKRKNKEEEIALAQERITKELEQRDTESDKESSLDVVTNNIGDNIENEVSYFESLPESSEIIEVSPFDTIGKDPFSEPRVTKVFNAPKDARANLNGKDELDLSKLSKEISKCAKRIKDISEDTTFYADKDNLRQRLIIEKNRLDIILSYLS